VFQRAAIETEQHTFIIVRSTQFSIDTLYVMHCYYMFRLTVAIKYMQFFYIHTLFMSAVPPYTGQCLHIGHVLFGYIALVLHLCYKMY
jgi:hypothetical protein